MATTMVLDEGRASTASLIELYGGDSRTVTATMLLAYMRGFVEVADVERDAAEVFAVTGLGWSMALLSLVTRCGAVTQEHLTERFELSGDGRSAKRFMQWGVDQGLLRPGGVMRSEPELMIATGRGVHRVGLTRLGVCRVSDRMEGHIRTGAMVLVKLERAFRYTHRVLSEREVFVLHGISEDSDEIEAIAHPVCRVDPETGKRIRKRPDLLMEPRRDGHDWVAAEVELSAPSQPGELADECVAWSGCETVGRVIYFTAPDVTPYLKRAIAEVPAQIDVHTSLQYLRVGERDHSLDHKLCIVELAAECVPRERRQKDYELQRIPGSRQYFLSLDEALLRTIRGELLSIVEWIGWRGFTPADAIAIRYGLSEADACQLLVLAHGAGWLDFTTMLREEGALFRISQAGRKNLGRSLPPTGTITYSAAIRQAACSRLAAVLECEQPDRDARAVIEMRFDYEVGAERLLRVDSAAKGLGRRVSPELMLSARGESAAKPDLVTIERGLIRESKVEDVIRAYSEYGGARRIYYYAAHQRVSKAAKKVVTKLGLKGKVFVGTLPRSRHARPL